MKIGNVIGPLTELQNTVHTAKNDIFESIKGINATVAITGQFPYNVAEDLNQRIKAYCDKLEKQLGVLIEADKEEKLYELRNVVVKEVLVTNQFITYAKSSVDKISSWLTERRV